MTDRHIHVATASRRNSAKWRNKKTTWEALMQKCSEPIRTAETLAEYKAMSRADQSERKDVGGFVGGYLKDGIRSKSTIEFRDVLCLDIDFGQPDTWDDFCLSYGVAAFCYSTHKYTSTKPRIRLVILLSRSVTPEEYEAIGRRVASTVGIDLFDDTTYEPERLMYWPSISSDGEWYFQTQDGPALDPDEVLATYHNWHDVSEWPYSSRVVDLIRTEASRQGDPTDKPGIVGAFCRCYDIHSVIEEYLSDEYTRTDSENRYTYIKGSVAAGLVVYEGGKFAYSHNATDPCSQHLVNAFDIVRLHKFGYQDEDTEVKTAITKRPSYRSMCEFAASDSKVKIRLTEERRSSAVTDFDGILDREEDDSSQESDSSWMEKLTRKKNGEIESTIHNASVILTEAPEFKGKLWHDEFSGFDRFTGRLPWDAETLESSWRNSDNACLRKHMEQAYGIVGKEKIDDALTSAFMKIRRHPIREYLRSLTWDGEPRLDTLLIDFLGAEDNELNRLQTRKQFVAAVARVFDPGCKHDCMLVLVGKEGMGKSRLLNVMAGPWFYDSLVTMDGKEAMESIRAAWIIEVAELTGMKRSEVENVKSFLSRQIDSYRPAYGRVTEEHKRQCIFFGTTNESNFLKGFNGNRRFWLVEINKTAPRMGVSTDLPGEYKDQVWAEAVHRYDTGEETYLSPEMEELAKVQQIEFNELADDERIGIIQQFLDTPLPLDWETRSKERRVAYFRNTDPLSPDGVMQRNLVSSVEILAECFNEKLDDKLRYKGREITYIMKQMPGWEPVGRTKCGVWGQQRAYRRKGMESSEEDIL